MKTRHLNELLSRLELVADLGAAVIRKEELKLWYDAERVGRAVFADIHDKWAHELEHEWPLMVGQNPGEYVFIWGQGLTADSDAWFKPISELSRKKVEKSPEKPDDEENSLL